MKFIRLFTLITLFISCSNNVVEKKSISFSEKNYDEAFQLIEYWLNAQKDYENLPGLTAMVGNEDGLIWSEAFGMANETNMMNI